MSYDNSKQVILRKVVSDSPNAPTMRITFEFNGQKYKAGLWPWQKKDGTPVTDKNGNQLYKGDYEVDDWEPNAQQNSQGAADPFKDEDIPF